MKPYEIMQGFQDIEKYLYKSDSKIFQLSEWTEKYCQKV